MELDSIAFSDEAGCITTSGVSDCNTVSDVSEFISVPPAVTINLVNLSTMHIRVALVTPACSGMTQFIMAFRHEASYI
jgi:hypothetical protein